MNKAETTLGHRVNVREALPDADTRPDYADAFTIARDPADTRSAERWARDGFTALPADTRRVGMLAHRYLLGFRLGPWASAGHVFGWQVAESRPEWLHLVARGPVMDGHMVWRRQADRLVMTTLLTYHHSRMAAAIWALAGRVHRRAAPDLLRRAARAIHSG